MTVAHAIINESRRGYSSHHLKQVAPMRGMAANSQAVTENLGTPQQ
jgi:hypothetical protein